jgi:ribosomal-protein-serine acetyltransferase
LSEPRPLPDTLAGDGVVLRRLVAADAEALHTAVSESLEHLRPWMPWAANEPSPIKQRC